MQGPRTLQRPARDVLNLLAYSWVLADHALNLTVAFTVCASLVRAADKPYLLAGTQRSEELLAQAVQPLDEWLRLMRFSSLADGTKTGLTPLRFAVLAGRVDLAREILAAGADVQARLRKPYEQMHWIQGETVLHTACAHHNLGALTGLLLEHSADPLWEDGVGHTCLDYSCFYGRPANFDTFVAHGASGYSCPKRGKMPHHYPQMFCGSRGQPKMLEHIRNAHADVWEYLKAEGNCGNGFPFMSMYIMMAISQNVEGFQVLLDGGFDPMRLDVRRNAFPMWLLRTLNRLVFNSKKAPSFLGMILYMAFGAIHVASYVGLLHAVEMIAERRPELIAAATPREAGGRTALHFAAIGNSPAVVSFLLSREAPLHVKDRFGKTPLDYARRFKHEDIVQLLAPQAPHQAPTVLKTAKDPNAPVRV